MTPKYITDIINDSIAERKQNLGSSTNPVEQHTLQAIIDELCTIQQEFEQAESDELEKQFKDQFAA